MNKHSSEDLSGVPMLDLFRAEADAQSAALTAGLLELERGTPSPECLETLMRAAHSLKGAARIVNLRTIERLAHALEDCFEAARRGTIVLRRAEIDVLLRAVDTLQILVKSPEDAPSAEGRAGQAMTDLVDILKGLERIPSPPAPRPHPVSPESGGEPAAREDTGSESGIATIPAFTLHRHHPEERVLRLTADNLNRLLGLAGESLVESRWLRPFAESLQRLKRHHMSLGDQLDRLRQVVDESGAPGKAGACFASMVQELAGAQQFLADRVQELDTYDRRSAHLSQRLYLEVLRTRMRPFSEGVRRFPRMVRDLARSLDKQVRLEISGESTQVDRDILERLEMPLGHLIRNAVDHGCEAPAARARAGKAAESIVRLEARHSAGVLLVTVSDDGAGVRIEELRRTLVRKHITPPAVAEKLTEAELLEYLFLPGFTLKQTVTEISGRGYGLDIVQNMVRDVRGAIRLQNQAGRGLRVQLQLPLTLSVLRALLVEVAGEPYAIPLNQISRTFKAHSSAIHMLDGRHYIPLADQQLGVLSAQQVFEPGSAPHFNQEVCVVVLGERNSRQGILVDRFLGERELVVQPTPAALGKIKSVSAAALMEDGAPVLILDVEDLLRSILTAVGAQASMMQRSGRALVSQKTKRILVVDDSPTVRQIEQRLLTTRGYATDVAADGLEAWSVARTGNYDLVITDLEMPRMDGLELAKLIKQEPDLNKTAVLIISYKDREEDRLRGLDAGADYYLTKGSFHDQTLLKAVTDLIGEPVM